MPDLDTEPIRCRPVARAAEVRPALWHGRNLVASACCVFATAVSVAQILTEFSLGSVVIFGAMLPLFSLFFFALPYDLAKKARPLEWIFSSYGVALVTPSGVHTSAWRFVRCLVPGRRTVLLHIGGTPRVAFIPRRALTAAELDQIIHWAQARGVDVRGPRRRPWR
jgi:hypothetical protein